MSNISQKTFTIAVDSYKHYISIMVDIALSLNTSLHI